MTHANMTLDQICKRIGCADALTYDRHAPYYQGVARAIALAYGPMAEEVADRIEAYAAEQRSKMGATTMADDAAYYERLMAEEA